MRINLGAEDPSALIIFLASNPASSPPLLTYKADENRFLQEMA
jgi:hypothetical protein